MIAMFHELFALQPHFLFLHYFNKTHVPHILSSLYWLFERKDSSSAIANDSALYTSTAMAQILSDFKSWLDRQPPQPPLNSRQIDISFTNQATEYCEGDCQLRKSALLRQIQRYCVKLGHDLLQRHSARVSSPDFESSL